MDAITLISETTTALTAVVDARIAEVIAEQCVPIALPDTITVENYYTVMQTYQKFTSRFNAIRTSAREYIMENEYEQIMIDHGFVRREDSGWRLAFGIEEAIELR
jgi:hypothetical protein|tara:strand:- start:602 stop:916 length:315 start_codon:yes stop_codon:yes gene_type:complete